MAGREPGVRPLSEVLDRRWTPRGELVLRTDGAHFEIVSNGVFLMDTRAGASERLLARSALDLGSGPARVLVGGLGVGFTLAEALRHPRVVAVTVVEVEPAVLDWQRTHLGERIGYPVADPRVETVLADLGPWLSSAPDRYDVICLDVDNGPGWTVTEDNDRLYGEEGVGRLAARLAPDGVLAVWSAHADEPFRARLAARFGAARTVSVPVPRGEPDVVFLAGSVAVIGAG